MNIPERHKPRVLKKLCYELKTAFMGTEIYEKTSKKNTLGSYSQLTSLPLL